MKKNTHKGVDLAYCLFESESTIQGHVLFGKASTHSSQYDLLEKVMDSGNTEQFRLCPFCNKGFSENGNFREKHKSVKMIPTGK